MKPKELTTVRMVDLSLPIGCKEKFECDPKHGDQGETKEKDHSALVGGSFNKQGNLLARRVLGSYKMSSSPSPPSWFLKIYIEALMGSGVQLCVPSRWCQKHITVSRLCPWSGSGYENSGQSIHSKDRGGGGKLSIPWVWLLGQPVVISSQGSLLTILW